MLTHLLLVAAPALAAPAPAPAAAPAAMAVSAQDSVDDLIAQGRQLLRDGKPTDAEAVFARAHEASGEKLDTLVWVLRSWIDQGRYNDAFEAIDEHADRDGSPVEVYYIHGMGSYKRALANQAAGGNSTLRLAWMDTIQRLSKVIEMDPARFDDAWQPLAHAAIEGNDPEHLALALTASEKALELNPDDGAVHEVRGRAHFWNYRELAGAGKEAEAAAALDAALASWQAGIAGTAPGRENAGLLVNLHLRLGVGLLWKQDKQAAAQNYSQAIGWWPSMVNYQELWQSLTLPEGDKPIQPYIDCLTEGRRLFDERWGASDPADSTMLWWLGWAHLTAGTYETGEEAFLASVTKSPTFLNSYWYAGLCRYYLKDYPTAAAHWARYQEGNPEDLARTIQASPQENVAIVFFTQGQLASKGEQDWPGQRDAAVLAEMLVRAEPKNWQRWNDLGLFCRNAGANLPDSEKGAQRRRAEYWMRARVAYETAMGLAPDMPHLYNDCAVILHYYLDTDLELAKELYEKSLEMATKQLDEGKLEGDALNLATIAKRDAANNLARLERKMNGDDEEDGGR